MTHNLSRRRFVLGTGAVISVGTLAGCTADDGNGDGNGDGVPDAISEYMAGAQLYEDSMADRTGQDEVVISVGAGADGVAFDPPAASIYSESTVRWEWTGDGGSHNVASVGESDEEFRSGDPVESADETFERSFDGGIQLYVCELHEDAGMLGALEVIEPSEGGGYG